MSVAFITGESNYTRLHYSNGKKNLAAITLARVLMRYPNLVRVSKHAAINNDFIESWEETPKGLFIILSQMGALTVVKVSRRKVYQIKKELMQQKYMI